MVIALSVTGGIYDSFTLIFSLFHANIIRRLHIMAGIVFAYVALEWLPMGSGVPYDEQLLICGYCIYLAQMMNFGDFSIITTTRFSWFYHFSVCTYLEMERY